MCFCSILPFCFKHRYESSFHGVSWTLPVHLFWDDASLVWLVFYLLCWLALFLSLQVFTKSHYPTPNIWLSFYFLVYMTCLFVSLSFFFFVLVSVCLCLLVSLPHCLSGSPQCLISVSPLYLFVSLQYLFLVLSLSLLVSMFLSLSTGSNLILSIQSSEIFL